MKQSKDLRFREAQENFRAWLSERGAEVLLPTNPWELIRFRANGQTSIVYQRKGGKVTYTGESWEAAEAWRSGDNTWNAGTDKFHRSSNSQSKRKLLGEQGPECFYCGEEFSPKNLTVEHLVPRAHGGPNHVSNKVLACETCNKRADHLSAYQKVMLREKIIQEKLEEKS